MLEFAKRLDALRFDTEEEAQEVIDTIIIIPGPMARWRWDIEELNGFRCTGFVIYQISEGYRDYVGDFA